VYNLLVIQWQNGREVNHAIGQAREHAVNVLLYNYDQLFKHLVIFGQKKIKKKSEKSKEKHFG
jgi:hypothetical protein